METVSKYLNNHSETIVVLEIFDFDIYKPIKAALDAVKPHLARGGYTCF